MQLQAKLPSLPNNSTHVRVAAADRGRYGGARNKILHVINAALAKANVKYTLPAFPSQPMDRRMLQLLGNLPSEAIPDVQPIPTS